MGLELAQVVAGLPMAASLAIASGLVALREGRRRSALNEAMHELRRPLQALSLALPEAESRRDALGSSLALASAALTQLDQEINGEQFLPPRKAVALEPLVAAAVARWRARAQAAGRSLRLNLAAAKPFVQGDEMQLAQALDNMISNAFDHGGGSVSIEVCEGDDRLSIAVIDTGRPTAQAGEHPRLNSPTRRRHRTRRGHGLRVVKRAAKAHGGAFELRRSESGTEARLEVPRQLGAGI